MAKPFSIKSYMFPKSYLYAAFALIVLISCWESNLTNAAVMEQTIPQESIRLRILANSDALEDQWVKRKVRDAVVRQMNGWVKEPQGIEAARKIVRDHLGDLSQTVGQTLQQYGFANTYKVELGIVPFPTKMYGDVVYPAGNYEALRVTLGKGEGQNWWCVLFPPLCFIDLSSGEAVPKAEIQGNPKGKGGSQQTAPKVEVRFFLWDGLKKMGGSIKGWL